MRRLSPWIARGGRRTPPGERLRRQPFRSSGFVDIVEGFAGVLVRPDFLDRSDCNIPPLLWPVDDIWLSGRMAMRGIPAWIEAAPLLSRRNDEGDAFPLRAAVFAGRDRRALDAQGIAHLREAHGIWSGRQA